MKTYNYDYPFDGKDFVHLPVPIKNTCFFDIETTGFSPVSCQVYLIGVLEFSENEIHIKQWFAANREDEKNVINAFFDYLLNFDNLVHFNGDTFDIPFIRKRCEKLNILNGFDNIHSIDLLKRARKLKTFLKLDSLKQKSIEEFLHIYREDEYDGGRLIKVYNDYVKDNDLQKEKLLILHNHDDMKGMPLILPFFSFEGILDKNNYSSIALDTNENEYIIYDVTMKYEFPRDVSYAFKNIYIICQNNHFKLKISFKNATLKYFFDNYKEYFYLPMEDVAIHKSVAAYVDKDYRKKATKENCYTKKEGLFLPAFNNSSYDLFFESRGGSPYMLYDNELFQNTSFAADYISELIYEII